MSAPRITWISRADPPAAFPPADVALRSPNGLLAAGGDLAPQRLLHAYRQGIFPWFETDQPILWWSPDPRCVLRPRDFHVARRFRRSLRRSSFEISFNAAFDGVIRACGEQRQQRSGTWITAPMIGAYSRLHRMGWAHSVEVWLGGKLAGGIYGLAIGRAFFGESMFSKATDGSKTAMLALCRELARRDFLLLDCQLPSPHLTSLGATEVPRARFLEELRLACSPPSPAGTWPGGRMTARGVLDSPAQPAPR